MRKLRKIVDPNVTFIIQLREWEKTILPITTTNETNDDNSGTNNSNNTRSTSNIYCGSTSKNKTDSKSHPELVLIT